MGLLTNPWVLLCALLVTLGIGFGSGWEASNYFEVKPLNKTIVEDATNLGTCNSQLNTARGALANEASKAAVAQTNFDSAMKNISVLAGRRQTEIGKLLNNTGVTCDDAVATMRRSRQNEVNASAAM